MTEIGTNPAATPVGYEDMNLMETLNDTSRAIALAVAAPPAFPTAPILDPASDTMRAGIRHIASGRMTVIHAGLKAVRAMLIERAASDCGLLEDPRLEAILVDQDRRVFAAFWQ
jgi:hypothetical protein